MAAIVESKQEDQDCDSLVVLQVLGQEVKQLRFAVAAPANARETN